MLSSPDAIPIFIFLIGFAGSFFVVRWTFEPLYASQVVPRQPTQFFTSDLYALILPLMIAGLVIFQPHNPRYPGYSSDVPIMITVTAVAAIFWWRGTVLLSRVAVLSAWRRFAFLALLMPLACGGSIAAVSMPLMVGYLFIGMVGLGGALISLLALPVWVALCTGVLCILRVAARWTLKGGIAPVTGGE